MTQRRRLDAFLLDAARERGTDVREAAPVSFSGAEPAVGGEKVRVDVIVGADGANGIAARAFGLGAGIVHGVALEGNVPYGRVDRERYARRAVVELADIPGGYAWVFPKGDHANVGVGAWRAEGQHLRAHLQRACAAHGLGLEDLRDLRGHRLPLRRPGTRIASERALLVGDAAGLIDPVSGDGMYECFVSASLAANAVLDLLSGRSSSLAAYADTVEAAVGRLHRASWTLKHALDRWPRATWRIARTRLLWRSVEELLLGELVAPGDQRGAARAPLRLLDWLGASALSRGSRSASRSHL